MVQSFNLTRKRSLNIGLFILFVLWFTWVLNCVNAYAWSLPDKIVIDNFEKPGKQNLLGGDFGAFADQKNLGQCYLFFTQNKGKDVLNKSKYFLYIQWDTSKEGAYGGYWSKLGNLNLEDYNYVSFYVKGFYGGEVFKVGLRGSLGATTETKILITEILSKGVTTEWQKVTIPLKCFKAIEDWHDVNIFSINFEQTFGSEKGSISIDDIIFEK